MLPGAGENGSVDEQNMRITHDVVNAIHESPLASRHASEGGTGHGSVCRSWRYAVSDVI